MILYKKDKKGKLRSLEIYTDKGYLYQISGLVVGKKVKHSVLCTPKNVGKANETSSITQAELEAEALITKKIKSGYSKYKDNLSEILLPMKVKIYQDQIKNVDPNPYLSPKLNGVNGEFRLKDGKLILLSRGGNEYPMLEHLRQPVIDYLNAINETSINVELYKHGWHLQDITAAVKKFKPDTHEFPSNQIEAHVFDIPCNKGTYEERLGLMDSVSFTGLLFLIESFQNLDTEIYFNECIKDGYEGIIIRNPKGFYKYNIRSSDVFKYKKSLDGEYKIIGYDLDKKGNPKLILEINSENKLTVRPKGNQKSRDIMKNNINSYIGKWYKIEYESLSKDNIPTKPVGIGLRDCDIYGNPLI